MNQRLAILSSFYAFASTFTITGPDGRPQVLLQRPSPTLGLRHKRPERTYRAFSEDELDRFFSVIPTDTVKGLRDRAIFLLYFWTARRREEIARLRWGDIEQATIVDELCLPCRDRCRAALYLLLAPHFRPTALRGWRGCSLAPVSVAAQQHRHDRHLRAWIDGNGGPGSKSA